MSHIISVSDEIYEKLTKLKHTASYSEVIKHLLEHKKDNKHRIMELAGKTDFDEAKLDHIKKGWKRWSGKSV